MPADDTATTDEAARAEHDLRREGRWCRAAGIAGALAIVFTALFYRFNTNGPAPYEVVLGALGCCAVAYLHGSRERATRTTRAAVEQALAMHRANAERLDRAEQHCAETRASVEGIAAHLPGVLERANWSGFNSAVRQGLGPTGTHGVGHGSRGHLGLVTPEV